MKPEAGMGGAYSAMVTPFTKDDKVNEGAIDQLVEYGIESGLRGFYLTGGTGEFTLMTVEERKQVFRRAAKAAKGRCKLIAHVGATRTDDAVELARYAEKVGCDWVSSVAPIYFGQSAAAQYAHYKMISEASGLPLMIYCFGNTLVPERDLKLFDLKNVKGMKYTGSDYYAVQSMRRRIGKETFFVSGRDEMLGCALALGDTFQGGIGTSYNMIPKHFVAIYEAARKGLSRGFSARSIRRSTCCFHVRTGRAGRLSCSCAALTSGAPECHAGRQSPKESAGRGRRSSPI